MKQYLILIATAISFFSKAQTIADPAISQVGIQSISGTAISATQLALNDVVVLQMRIQNNNTANAIPAGSMKLKIGLGSKAQLDPAFILANAPLAAFFTWTSFNNEGQIEITGDLKSNLPPGFADFAQFRIAGSILGSSTMTINFLVTNHNTNNNLSDENGSNNFASLPYFINPPLPLNFRDIAVRNNRCQIEVVFKVADEIDVQQYELEASTDGLRFSQVGRLEAKKLPSYSYAFKLTPSFESENLFVRIKAIDKDGSVTYSKISAVSGTCSAAAFQPVIFPNPVAQNLTYLTIYNKAAPFKGEYIITIVSGSGQVVTTKKINANNQQQMMVPVVTLARGEYFMRIQEGITNNSTVLKFHKL
jgi:hypothetical protein